LTLTSVALVLLDQREGDALLQLGPLVSAFLGPSPHLSLSEACAFASTSLLDWMWSLSCTSVGRRASGWRLANYLRSEPHYYRWQFWKAMKVAAERGDLALVSWLFAHLSGCVVPVEVVEVAAKNGHLGVLQFLLGHDAGRFEQEKGDGIVVHWGGRSMLHSIEQGHVEIARWLKENSPHQMDNDEIRWAVEYSLRVPDMDLALFFLPEGRSIVEFAHDDPHPETVEKLLEEGYTRQDEHCAAVSIYMLARVGRLDLMHRIVQLHSPPRARPRFDWSSEWFFATKEACKFGDLSVVRWLMEHPIGKRVAEAYEHQHSAGPEHFFALAAAGGHVEVMEYLDNEGYSDSFKDAAILAIRNGHLEAIKWLLRNHSYFSDTFMVEEAARCGRINFLHEGCTTRAMDKAASNGHLDVVQWLHTHRSE
ncbi:hypothetical protein PHYSODRAFT_452119, partial [Phytophthora sojae]